VEILVLPKAGMRWLIVAVLGAFHGLYFELFLRTTGYRAIYVLSGAVCAEIALIAILALLFSYLGKLLAAWKPVPVCASVLLVTGMASPVRVRVWLTGGSALESPWRFLDRELARDGEFLMCEPCYFCRLPSVHEDSPVRRRRVRLRTSFEPELRPFTRRC
jgi:hypothetical protein